MPESASLRYAAAADFRSGRCSVNKASFCQGFAAVVKDAAEYLGARCRRTGTKPSICATGNDPEDWVVNGTGRAIIDRTVLRDPERTGR